SHQQEMRLRGRLLQPFQQGVCSVRIQAFSRLDQHHAGSAAMARKIDEIGKLAHLLDCDLRAPSPFPALPRLARFLGLFRLKEPKIRMTALLVPGTSSAGIAARASGERTFAEQGPRQFRCKCVLANALRTGDQQRMGQRAAAHAQFLQLPGMPRQYHDVVNSYLEQKLENMFSSDLRTAVMLALASITR